MNNYIMLSLSAILLAANFSVTYLYQKTEGVSAKAGFKFTALVGLATALIFGAINGFDIEVSRFSVLLSALSAALCMLYTIIGFRIMKKQGIALYTLFLMTGGMVVPYVWGVFFLEEPFLLSRTTGLVLITIAVILSKWNSENGSLKEILLCVIVFFLNGFVSVTSKLHSIENVIPTVNETSFVTLSYFFSFVISGVCCLLSKKNPEKEKTNMKLMLPLIVISAIFGGISYFMQLTAAKSVPATVLYPFVTGGSIIFAAVAERVIYKEKIKKNVLVGICVCFVGTLLFV